MLKYNSIRDGHAEARVYLEFNEGKHLFNKNKTHLDLKIFQQRKNLSKNKVRSEVKEPVYSLK